MAEEFISNGTSGKVTIVSGINGSQTGLTTGRAYYVQNDGGITYSSGISTVPSTPSVVAGTSISSTEILVNSLFDIPDLGFIEQNAQSTSYTLVNSDAGKHVSISSGDITVPQNVFIVGNIVTIYNNSASSRLIIQGTDTTLRKAGTVNTGNCSLAEYGTASILCVDSNVFVVSGNIV